MISERWQKPLLAFGVGLAGALAVVTPTVLRFEEEAGLDLLFQLRGPIAAPTDVVVVSIDSESANALGLRLDPEDWPRSFHAEAVGRLRDAGASVVAVDLSFQRPSDSPSDDQFLADAIREAGNVILLEWLDEPVQAGGAPSPLAVEQRILPITLLADAALGTAPFPLPAVPAKVSRFWVFGRIDSDVATLPAAALHAHAIAAHDELIDLIESVRPGAAATLTSRAEISPAHNLTAAAREIRRLFQSDPDLARDLEARIGNQADAARLRDVTDAERDLAGRLVALYAGPSFRHLNYYGPARSITTVPYVRMLAMTATEARTAFNGKAVFVGFSEPRSQLEDDDLQTPFSERSGTDLAGVEIGATAFANLLTGRFVQPVASRLQFVILLLFGAAVAIALLWMPTRLGVLVAVAAGPAYVFLAATLFKVGSIWLPMITPVVGQIPLALIGAFAWKFAHAKHHGDRALRTLETYLPKRAVDELFRRVGGALPDAQLLHGTCLITDAQNYTALAERLPPHELQKVLNSYYAVLFPEVERRDGFVADVVGDSMVAIWATPRPDPASRHNACHAALAIQRATRDFNDANPAFPLPTRIGLHAGEILLGNVGTQSHLEYRAIGDIVNTASRIQDLNKQLRTTFLASEDVLQDAGVLSYRRLGEFLLAGKGVPIRLCDLVSPVTGAAADQAALIAAFSAAHQLFLARRWNEAAAAFEALVVGNPDDGPSAFFFRLSRRFAAHEPGAEWTGAVSIGTT
jgi:adenylate cyclase